MSNRIINRDRRRSWRYRKVFCNTFLYLGLLSFIAATPVVLFTLAGYLTSLYLAAALILSSIVFFSLYAYFVNKYRR